MYPPEALNHRGMIRAQEGDNHAALEAFTQALECDANYPHAYFGRGSLRAALGDVLGGREDLQMAAEAFRSHGDIVGVQQVLDRLHALL
jgi:lipoprotein NlpI